MILQVGPGKRGQSIWKCIHSDGHLCLMTHDVFCFTPHNTSPRKFIVPRNAKDLPANIREKQSSTEKRLLQTQFRWWVVQVNAQLLRNFTGKGLQSCTLRKPTSSTSHVSCPCNKPPHFWKGALGKQIEWHSNDPRTYSIRSNTSNCVNLILHVRQNFWHRWKNTSFPKVPSMDLIWWRQRSEIMASQEKMSSYVSNAMAKLLGWCWKSESI